MPLGSSAMLTKKMKLSLVMLLASDVASRCYPLDPKSPCKVECAGPPILRFDLSELNHTGKPYLNAQDDQNRNFWFGACTSLKGVTCAADGCSDGKQVTAVQSWSGSGPDYKDPTSCANLGCWESQNCTALFPPATHYSDSVPPGMQCRYTGGTKGRSLTVNYQCAPHLPTAVYHASSIGDKYTITLEGPGSCGTVWVKPLSWGSLTLILMCVALTLYLGGGVGYNIKVAKKQGVAAIPQIQYWKLLPGLVKDGCKFSYETSRKGYYSAVHGSAPPLHSDLKLRLADNEDGGGDRT